MKIGYFAPINFEIQYAARDKSEKIYRMLSSKHEVQLLNLNRASKSGLPEHIKGCNFSGIDSLPLFLNYFVILIRSLLYCSSQEKFDAVYSYNSLDLPIVVAYIYSLLTGVPLVVGVNDHRTTAGIKEKILNYHFRGHVLRKADLIILESRTLYSELERFGVNLEERNITVIPSSVDIEKFEEGRNKEKEGRDEKIVYYVGRKKDTELIFESAPIVAEEISNVKFWLVGKVGEKVKEDPELKEKNYFRSWGFMAQEKLLSTMNEADVCIVPYKNEETAGRPLKLLQYMAMGQTTVVTDLPFNTQMIEDGVNGIITKPDPKDFADAIIKVLKDDELRAELGKEARKSAQKYSFESVRDKLEKSLESVLNK